MTAREDYPWIAWMSHGPVFDLEVFDSASCVRALDEIDRLRTELDNLHKWVAAIYVVRAGRLGEAPPVAPPRPDRVDTSATEKKGGTW